MRVLHICLPLLIASHFACKNKPATPSATTVPTFEKAYSFFEKNNDSAFYYFNKIATGSGDTIMAAIAYTYMGMIQGYEGDYYGGQESVLKSLSLLDERKSKNQEYLLSNYNELGRISSDLKNYDAALDNYNKALEMTKDTNSRIIAMNNIAMAYQEKGNYDQAAAIYHSIRDQGKTNHKEYARRLSNYAKVKWLRDPNYNAAPEMMQALQIRKQENDNRGLNASYAHLSDYYAASRPDSALIYANKMHEAAKQIDNPDDQLEAIKKLIDLSPATSLKQYFARYHYLTDSLQKARNAAKNQFAVIRYDNLQLQKDNAQKEATLTWQRSMIGLIVLIALAAVILIIFRSRHAIQKNQLKTSQKVHDVVANGLYRVMTKMEYQDNIDKEQMLDEIEDLYERSRNLSYEQRPVKQYNFHDKIASLLTSFSGSTTKVLIKGNTETLWHNTTAQVQLEIEQVLQELMVNMKKHSGAHNVFIKFERPGEQIHIQYTDDGIGLPHEIIYGNGLTNTENRIKMLGGQITFDRTVTKGLKIQISFPTD